MKFQLEHLDQAYVVDTNEAVSLAIALQFDGPQPNHFGTDKADQEILRLGDFVGKTELGGSCNVDILEFIPHCNGTHTETVSHIVHQDIWIGHSAMDIGSMAALVSVPIRPARQTDETYRPALDATDFVITRRDLQARLHPFKDSHPQAVILRTLPNPVDKQQRQYAEGPGPAFLTVEAMEYVDSLNCQHLLVDLPSVDRMYDDGLLTNHHVFWHVPEGTHDLTPETRQERTITEMIFVPEDARDGLYLLNLQIPAFATDAAPSRPVIMPARKR